MINFYKKTIVFLFLIANLHACKNNGEIVIVDDLHSDFSIVVDDAASAQFINSAKLLQRYVYQMTAVNLPIVDKEDLKADEKAIFLTLDAMLPETTSIHYGITDSKHVYLSAKDFKNLECAIYDFLENVAGCIWLTPDTEIVPVKKQFAIRKDLNYTYTPKIKIRTVNSRLFYENPDFAKKHKVTTEAFPNYVPTARVHTFEKFVPEAVYFKKHPEYYALIEGERRPTQLCLSNKEVLKIVIDSVQSAFTRFPKASVISVSQNDNTLYCQCDKCREIDAQDGSPSGSLLQFVNQVAQHFPKKTISTLAYQYTRKAPAKTLAANNVLITLCSIECDRSAPIEEKCTDFANDLVAWKEITPNIRIWDYTTQFTNFLSPFPNLQTLQPNIQFFTNNNAQWIFEQHSNAPSELFELRSYLTAKLLWNPEADVKLLINQFTEAYYEKAAPYIREYIATLHNEMKKDADFFLYLYGDPSQAFGSFLSPILLEKYNNLFDKAEAVVANKPKILQHVQAARLGVDYASLEMAKTNISTKYPLTKQNEVAPDLLKRLARFEKVCKVQGIAYLNEMRYSVADYLKLHKKTVKRATQENLAKGAKVKLLTKPKKYAAENPQVLTDGAFGGASFFANWLGFEGNNMEAVIDLGNMKAISYIEVSYLQVTNHIVFFPDEVDFAVSADGINFKTISRLKPPSILSKQSKMNDIASFAANFNPQKARFIKIVAKNKGKAPIWHNAAGLPAWIFADEVIVH